MSFLTDDSIAAPSWRGHLETRMDALHLIHAARLGYIKLVPRRPSASEMRQIVDAGAIFVFEVKGSFNNWNDYSTQWTHLNNGMRRGGYTNSVSATVVPEFRKKITRFQIGSTRYQVVCYHNDVSKNSSNLSKFPQPVVGNSIPTDQSNTSTTLNFRLKGCTDQGCEVYEWVKTADQASETSELLEDEAHARQYSRSPLPLPTPSSTSSSHEELVSALYPEENLTYKYKYRYKTTIRNSQMQASQDVEFRYDMLSQPEKNTRSAPQKDLRSGSNQSPIVSTSSTSLRRSAFGHTQGPPSPSSPLSPQRDYYSHLGVPGPRYNDSVYIRQHDDFRRSSPSTRSSEYDKTHVDSYERTEAWDARHERNSSAPITTGYSSSIPVYAVHGRAFSHSGVDAYGRPLAYQTRYSPSLPPPPTGSGAGKEYDQQSLYSHTSAGDAASGQYSNAPQGWRIIAPAPAPYRDGSIPPARELIDGAMRKEREREQRGEN